MIATSLNPTGPKAIEHYRKRAHDCHEQAEKAISLASRTSWQRMAEEWLGLAHSTHVTMK